MIDEDGLETAAQPQCPSCGTVLRDVAPGFECKTCGLRFIHPVWGPPTLT